jgi:hypothetical protein
VTINDFGNQRRADEGCRTNLLDAIRWGNLDFAAMPEDLLRPLFEDGRMQVGFNKLKNEAVCTVSTRRFASSRPPQPMGIPSAQREVVHRCGACPRQGTNQKGTRTTCGNATYPGGDGDAGGPTDAVVSLDGLGISPRSLRFLSGRAGSG